MTDPAGVLAARVATDGMLSPSDQLAVFVFALAGGVVLVIAQQWWIERGGGDE